MPFYPSPLRDDGYDIADYRDDQPVLRHDGGLPALRGRGARARPAGHHRARHQPHLRPASLVPGGPRRAKPGSPERDFYVWSDTDTEVHRHAHHLPRHRDLELDLGPGRQAVFLAPLLLAPARPELRQSGACSRPSSRSMRYWLDMGVDGLRLDAIPYLIERDGTNCENLPETHDVIKAIRAALDAQLSRPHAAGRGQPVAGGDRALFRRRRRMPHGVPLPADAAHVHGARAGGPAPDHRHHAPDARRSRRAASGRSSCATTTS